MSDEPAPFEPVEPSLPQGVDLEQFHEEGPPCICCGSCHYLRLPGAEPAQAHKAWCRPIALTVQRLHALEDFEGRNFETASRVLALGAALSRTNKALDTSSKLHAATGEALPKIVERLEHVEVYVEGVRSRIEWANKTIALLIDRVEKLEGGRERSNVRQEIGELLTKTNLQSAPEHEAPLTEDEIRTAMSQREG